MTEFNDIELATEISDMEGEEAKETLADFMEVHESNREAYDELQSEFSQTEQEYEKKLEEKQERIAEFKQEKAERAAEHVQMPADLLADRFSFSEIDQIIEEAAEFTEEEDETDEGESGNEQLTTFSDKEQKGRLDGEGGNRAEYRERAVEVLGNKNFPVSE